MYNFYWVVGFLFPLRIHRLFKDIHEMPQGRNDSARVSPMLRMYVTTKHIQFIRHKCLLV